jgi:bacteriocin-like protein
MNIKHSNDVRRLTKNEMKQISGGWTSGPCAPGQLGINMPCPLRGNPGHVVCCSSVADCQLANIQLCWVA